MKYIIFALFVISTMSCTPTISGVTTQSVEQDNPLILTVTFDKSDTTKKYDQFVWVRKDTVSPFPSPYDFKQKDTIKFKFKDFIGTDISYSYDIFYPNYKIINVHFEVRSNNDTTIILK